MMDFIFVPLVVGVITLGIYKFFELLVCRRERRMIIDKMDGNALIDYLKFVPMGVRIGAPVSVRPVSGGVSGTLKAGCLLLGIGFGLLFAFMLLNWCAYDASYEMRSIVYGGSVLCFGGVGLIVSFIVERNIVALRMAGTTRRRGLMEKRSIPLLGDTPLVFPGAGQCPGGGTVCRSPDACRLPAGRPYSIGRMRTSVTPSNSRTRRSMSVFSSTSP